MIPGKLSMDLATVLTIGWFAIHLLGMFAAWGVRLSFENHFSLLIQSCFFFTLLAVSGAALIGHICGFETWHLSAATLAAMIVLAVVDMRVYRPVSA